MADEMIGKVISDFVIDSFLAAGNFAKVYRGHHNVTKEIVAVKYVDLDDASVRHLKERYSNREIKAMENLPSHKHVMRMLDHQILDDSIFLVLEYCDMGSLDKYLNKVDVPESQQILFIKEAVEGVYHLHSQDPPVVHRDLKTENLLLKVEHGKLVLKLGDFGTAREFTDDHIFATVIGIPLYFSLFYL